MCAGWGTLVRRLCAIRVLVELGANKDAKTANGGTPLYVAALFGKVEAVKVLAECGVNISARTNNGRTPLEVSTLFHNWAI